MIRCPVCKASLEQGPACRRCKADLSLLFQLDEQRQQALQTARACLQRGEWRRASAILDGVEALRCDDEVRRLRAAALLMQRDFAGAWRVYQETTPSSNNAV
jgi:hypothetical protein